MARRLVLSIFFSLLSLSLVAQTRPEQSPASEPLEIIDVHTHPEFSGKHEWGIDVTRDTYDKEWKEAGLVGAVGILHTQDGRVPDLGDRDVVYCGGVYGPVDVDGLEKGLESHAYGCLKIYLGYVHKWAYDPSYEPVYALAKKYGVPVIFHTGDTSTTRAKLKYADPLTIDEVAVDHPDVRFVIAHCGNPWIESAAEVAYKNPNVYIECSAMIVGDANDLSPQERETFIVKPIRWIFQYIDNPSKMMFGSDWPVTRIAPYVEAYKEAIPKKYWKAVFHDNAVKVFGLGKK